MIKDIILIKEMRENTPIKFFISLLFIFVLISNTICLNFTFHAHNDSPSICYEQIDNDDNYDLTTPVLISCNTANINEINQIFTYKPLICKFIIISVFQPPENTI